MSARQSAELDHAFERNGYTPADVKLLSQGDKLAKILPFLKGLAKIEIVRHIIDLDANPFLPKDWKGVAEHRKGGQFEWSPEKVLLYLSENQQNGKYIVGNELRKELANKPVLNANVLDYLLAHPELIPEEWKGKAVFFWGTIYRRSDDHLVVRCLDWDGERWHWSYNWLDRSFHGRNPAASLAS